MKIFIKDPDSILDYSVDWGYWLSDVVDTISTSTWIVESGLTEITNTNTTTTSTIWISGGTLGTTYLVTNRITTAGGRSEDKSFYIKIKNK